LGCDNCSKCLLRLKSLASKFGQYGPQVYKKQELNFSFPGPKTENFTPTLPNN
jgi:hypothetical protein